MRTPRRASRTPAIEGGFRALEITLFPGAVDLVRRLAAQYSSKGVAVGAGTVLDSHAAYECIHAGATFLVSPHLNREMIRVANRYQVSSRVAESRDRGCTRQPSKSLPIP